MKRRPPPSAWVLAGWAGIVSLTLALALGAWRAHHAAATFFLETEVISSVAGRAQLYFDTGAGLSEKDSAGLVVAASHPQRLRFPLPAGTYRALRFDPIDGEGSVTFSPPRILAPRGAVVAELPPAQWHPNDQIERFERGAPAQIVARSGVNDPYLTLSFPEPLTLAQGFWSRLWSAGRTLIAVFLCGWAAAFALALAARSRDTISRAAVAHPRAGILLAATGAALLATYPVVFAGKSFVSPNIVPLLRQSAPTLPGQTDATHHDLRTPDPAAMMWQNVPYSAVQHEAVFDHGELPLWNRYSSAGLTLLGQGQSMIGDPFHWMVVAARGAAWAWDVKFVLARLVFAAGLGLIVWRLTGSLRAALLTAVAGPFVGFFNFRFNHPAVFSFAYSPWILVGWVSWIKRSAEAPVPAGPWRSQVRGYVAARRPAMITLVAANAAVVASGTVKEACALLLVLNTVGAAAWLLTPGPSAAESRPRDAVTLAGLAVVTLLITAPLWLTFFSALRDSVTAYETPQVWQAPRWFGIGLLDSLFFVELHSRHWGYLAAANLVFAGGALVALEPLVTGRGPAPLARRFGLVLAGGFLGCVALAFGFVPAEWIADIPLLRSIYHVHNTFSAPAVVLLCILGGLGLREAMEHPTRRGTLIAGAVALALLAVYFQGQPEAWRAGHGLMAWLRGIGSHRFFTGHLALGVLAFLVLVRTARPRAGGRSPLRLVALIAALVVLLYRHGLHLPLGWGDTYLTHPMSRADLNAPSPVMKAARADSGGEPFRLIGTDLNVVNGWNAMYGVESINGPDAIMNRHYRELAEAVALVTPGEWRFGLSPGTIAAQSAWLDFVGVRYVASDGALSLPSHRPVGDYDLKLYRSEGTWPRAFFVSEATTYDSPRHLIDLLRARKTPFAAWDSSDREARSAFAAHTRPPQAVAAVPATHYRLTANTTTFRVRAPAAGLIVLQETWSPGDLKVTINGAAVPCFRINHAFRAITVPAAGDYTVRFAYWPRVLTPALWLAAAGLALFLLPLGWARPTAR